ncbi:MDMPI-like protein [Micromonospora palomenae]|uniref:MDMPI-like protein n=1 Tax=Micromonospora palomenae TaxID=1461247 RepID=A0A561WXI2_9ACTN|nr:MDMPI-like protein [Micromonospora palomenae]
MHTYDAQLTVGAPQPLPNEVALDGFDDCQYTLCATTVAWPHEPAVVDYHATEGCSWRLRLSRDGARVARFGEPAASEDPGTADASARGTASDLVLFFYGRIPLDSLKWDGDRRIFDQLIAWDPSV